MEHMNGTHRNGTHGTRRKVKKNHGHKDDTSDNIMNPQNPGAHRNIENCQICHTIFFLFKSCPKHRRCHKCYEGNMWEKTFTDDLECLKCDFGRKHPGITKTNDTKTKIEFLNYLAAKRREPNMGQTKEKIEKQGTDQDMDSLLKIEEELHQTRSWSLLR